MTQTLVPSQAPVRRLRLTHHPVGLDGGHVAGASVGGAGVPLVFMHGLALSRRAYLPLLSRIAGLGFLLVAVDAAGHGDPPNLPCNAGELADRVDLTLRALDVLGVRQAVFAGHSMGGRMAIQLAAVAPERVLAAVLLDAAAGARFDDVIPTLLRSPRQAPRTIVDAANDTRKDPFWLHPAERSHYLRMLFSAAGRNARRPSGVTGAARAIVQSGDYTPMLFAMCDEKIPTMVVHGENDRIVPFDCARDIADDADGTLYMVPGAYHSWMIANPRQGADAIRQLVDGELGGVLRDTADELSISDVADTGAWHRGLLEPDALLLDVVGDGTDEVGLEDPEPVELDVVRRAERPRHAKRMLWARRRYRQRAARRAECGA